MKQQTQISDAETNGLSQTKLFVLAAFAVGQGMYVNDSHRDLLGLACILFAIIALFAALRGSGLKRLLDRVSMPVLLAICLGIEWMQLVSWGIHAGKSPAVSLNGFIIPIALAGAGVIVAVARANLRALGLCLLVAGHAAAGVYAIRSAPQPFIDVWYLQQGPTAALLRGENPYTVPCRNIYAPDEHVYSPGVVKDGWLTCSHPYPPLSLILAAPGRIFGDVRWSYLVAMELAAVLMVFGLRSEHRLASGLMLLNPASLFVIQSAWTEPMIILLIGAVLWAAQRAPKYLWVPIGLLLASKQYAVILMPLAMLLQKQWMTGDSDSRGDSGTASLPASRGSAGASPSGRRAFVATLFKAGVLALVTALPFIAWNASAFYRNVIWWHLNCPFRVDCLSFPAFLASFTGFQLPSIVAFVFAGVVIVWAIRKLQPSPATFSGACALVLLVFISMNRQAFCNYYFLVVGVTSMAIAASSSASEGVRTRDEVDEPVTAPERLAA